MLWQRLDDPLPHVLNVGEKSVTIETEGRDAVRLKMKVLDKSIAMEVVDFSTKIEEAKKLEASLSAVFIETSRIANDAQLLIEEHAMKKRSVMISLELINGQLGGGGDEGPTAAQSALAKRTAALKFHRKCARHRGVIAGKETELNVHRTRSTSSERCGRRRF